MEASALTYAGRRGLIARRSPLLRLQGDDRLVALLRGGNDHAFEVIVDRYQTRLLGFCRQMLGSTEDAEDVLQEVFVNAHRAILADQREIKLRPWLYRIARNRCLNHLRKPTSEGQDSMDIHPITEAASTHECVQNREEFRQLLCDVTKLPETQRSALLLREMDALSYEEIAQAMDTTVPSVKSLLVRARIALAEASQARQLTCGEVRLELAEAAEGVRKASGPVRRHVRDCEECGKFRSQLRCDSKALAAVFPVGPLALLKSMLLSKLGLGGSAASGGVGAGGVGAGSAGAGGAGSAALGGSGAATGGIGTIGAAGAVVSAKAVAGVVTAVVLTASAVAVKDKVWAPPTPTTSTSKVVHSASSSSNGALPTNTGSLGTTSAPSAAASSNQNGTTNKGPTRNAGQNQANQANASASSTASGSAASTPATTTPATGVPATTNGATTTTPSTTTAPATPPANGRHHHRHRNAALAGASKTKHGGAPGEGVGSGRSGSQGSKHSRHSHHS